MKKSVIGALLTVMMLSVSACGSENSAETVNEPVAESTTEETVEETEVLETTEEPVTDDSIVEEPESDTEEQSTGTIPSSDEGWYQVYTDEPAIASVSGRSIWERNTDESEVSYEKQLLFVDGNVSATMTVPYTYTDVVYFNLGAGGSNEGVIKIDAYQFGYLLMGDFGEVTDEVIQQYEAYTEEDLLATSDLSKADASVDIENTDEIYKAVFDIERRYKSSDGTVDGNLYNGKMVVILDKVNHVGAFFHVCDIVEVGEATYADAENFEMAQNIVDTNYDEATIDKIVDSIQIAPASEASALADKAVQEYVKPEEEYADVTVTYINDSDVDLSKVNIFYLGGETNIDFGNIPAGSASSVVLNIPVNQYHLLDAEYYCGDQMLSYWARPIQPFHEEITVHISNIDMETGMYDIYITTK